MRKIYQSAPDVPQSIANKAIDMVERHLVANGVRRAEELPEESKVHLMRELQKFFEAELPRMQPNADGTGYAWSAEGEGLMRKILRKLERLFGVGDVEYPPND